MIGDWGATVYTGQNESIKRHLLNCLEAVNDVAEYAQAGMRWGDMSRFAAKVLKKRELTGERLKLTTKKEASGVNCGHTLPWSDIGPTHDELAILATGDQQQINQLISSKRVFIDADEDSVVPGEVIFTCELRLESLADPKLPNGYYHILVKLSKGTKVIYANFNEVFEALGMTYMHSKY